MHPVFSIGIYLLMQIVILLLTRWCLNNNPALRFSSFAGNAGWVVFLLVYALLTFLPIGGAMLPDSSLKFAFQGAGNIWLGFNTYFSGILLILSCFAAVCQWIFRFKKGIVHLGIWLVSFAAGAVLLVYGMVHAQHTVVTTYDVTIEKSAGGLENLKVVLLADLHLSVNSNLPMIERMTELVNREDPDVILIAGDIFTSSYEALGNPEGYAAVLRQMNSKYGTYAVYGNHDVEETLFGGFPISPISQAFRTSEMERFFKDCGFTVLYDETVLIADGAVQVVGRVDGEKAGDGSADRKSAAEVLAGVDTAKPVLILEHEPVEFGALKENGADLALCGHTHAGQIFPGNLIIPLFNENAYGYRLVGGLDTIVTSGIGFYGPPMRVGTNSEITVVNLHFNPAGDTPAADDGPGENAQTDSPDIQA